MSASARIPRQALLAVRRRGALYSCPSARSARVPPCAWRVDSFSLRVQLLYAYIYIWLLAVEATAERSARVPSRALCQRLGVRTITSGAHMHAVAPRALPRDAVTCGMMELRAVN